MTPYRGPKDIDRLNKTGDLPKGLARNEAERTLTNLSESTLSFILEEQLPGTNKLPAKVGTAIIPPAEPMVDQAKVDPWPVKPTPFNAETPIKPAAGPIGSTPNPSPPSNASAAAGSHPDNKKSDVNDSGSTFSESPSFNDPSKDPSSISIIELSDTMLEETAISIGSSDEDDDGIYVLCLCFLQVYILFSIRIFYF